LAPGVYTLFLVRAGGLRIADLLSGNLQNNHQESRTITKNETFALNSKIIIYIYTKMANRHLYARVSYENLSQFGAPMKIVVSLDDEHLNELYTLLMYQLRTYNNKYRIQFGDGVTEPPYYFYPRWNIFIDEPIPSTENISRWRLSRTSHNTSANHGSVYEAANYFMSHLTDHLEYMRTNPHEVSEGVSYRIEPHDSFKRKFLRYFNNPNHRDVMLHPIGTSTASNSQSFHFTVAIDPTFCACNEDTDATTLEPLVNPVIKFPNTRHCFNLDNNIRKFNQAGQIVWENPFTRDLVPETKMITCESNNAQDNASQRRRKTSRLRKTSRKRSQSRKIKRRIKRAAWAM